MSRQPGQDRPAASAPAVVLERAERQLFDKTRAAVEALLGTDLLRTDTVGDPDAFVRARVAAATGLRLLGEPAKAMPVLERAFVARELPGVGSVSRAQCAILRAQLADELGDAAVREDSLRLTDRAPEHYLEGRCDTGELLLFMASTFMRELHHGDSAARTSEVLFRWMLGRGAVEPVAAMWGWEALATARFRQGRYLEAADDYAQVLAQAGAAGQVPKGVVAMLNLASCFSQLLDADQLCHWADRAWRLVNARGWPVLEAVVGLRRSSAQRRAGRVSAAKAQAEASLATLRAVGPGRNTALAWLALGTANLRLGAVDDAIAQARQVVELSQPRGEVDLMAEGALLMGWSLLRRGERGEALRAADEAEAWSRQANHSLNRARAQLLVGTLSAVGGEGARAAAAINDCRRIVRGASWIQGFVVLDEDVRLAEAVLGGEPQADPACSAQVQALLRELPAAHRTEPERLARLEAQVPRGWR